MQNLPSILIILDGWGIASSSKGNAIKQARTPNIDSYLEKYPNTKICAHGECVGLPAGQDGNSEAGHLNIGAGRIVEQEAVRINEAIKSGDFFKNHVFLSAVAHVKKQKSNLHIMGLLSDAMSPHSHPEHLKSLVEFARKQKIKNTYLHLFTDGRDSYMYSALKMINAIERDYLGDFKIATLMGRYYAMDRKKNWRTTQAAYDALVLEKGKYAESPQEAITCAYNSGESDEFISPTILQQNGKTLPRINHNDAVIFFNFRSDRARQLAKAFVQPTFNKKNLNSFRRGKVLKNLYFAAMTDFGPDLDSIITAFPSDRHYNALPKVLENLSQLYISEKEKYAHVTYFFNGGSDSPVNGEERLLVLSPNVKHYEKTPAMASRRITDIILENLKSTRPLAYLSGKGKWRYDFTTVNFAAPDMIAHTGNLEAGIQCCEVVDKCVGKIVKAYLKKGGTVIITADHGNIEEMVDLKTGEINTKHSINPVPFILISKDAGKKYKLRSGGKLADIAPTILDLIGISKPNEMTGKSLVK